MALTFREFLIVTEAFQEAEGATLTEGAIWDKIQSGLKKIGGKDSESKVAQIKKDIGDKGEKLKDIKKTRADIEIEKVSGEKSEEFYARKALQDAKGKKKDLAAKASNAHQSARDALAKAAADRLNSKPLSQLRGAELRRLDRNPFEGKEAEIEANFKRLTEAQTFVVTYELKNCDKPKKAEIDGANVTRVKRKFEDTHHGAKIITIIPK